MRLYLKTAVLRTLSVLCFVVLTLNFYIRSVWVAEMESTSRPWGRDFDPMGHHIIHNRNSVTTQSSAYVIKNVSLESIRQKQNPVTLISDIIVNEVSNKHVVWPSNEFYNNDRITNQLKYKPEWLHKRELEKQELPLKKILLFGGLGGWEVKRGSQTFLDQKCTVNTCEITDSREAGRDADAVLFSHTPANPWVDRPQHQVWILFMLESPYHTPGLGGFGGLFNWTATYRHDSDIVAPYEKFELFNENVRTLPQNKSYAAGKTKQVAWFVSNCGARNRRLEYAKELGKYISVDIYGSCGSHKCPRRDSKCFEMLNTDYKFYLSFENSNCRDYITEKFFVTGLQHDVIPIVMGGAPEDYERAAPLHSFIHVDEFESPEELAKYLHKLDQNDDLYNEYFRWKGTGSFINTFFWCRMCGMLHEESRGSHVYSNLERWWRGPEVCIGKDSWRDHPRASPYIMGDFLLKQDPAH